MSKTILLLSGGIDSMVCLALLLRARRTLDAVHVDYGQAAAHPERAAADSIASSFRTPLRILRLDFGHHFGPGEIPFRNATLIFSAAMAARPGTDEVAIGIHAGVPYPDCTDEFLESVKTTMRSSYRDPIGVAAPLITWGKQEIIAFAVQESLPLSLTYSCEAGSRPPCGLCESCQDRTFLSC